MLQQENSTDGDISASEETMKSICDAAPPRKHRIPGVETDADEESGMWSLHEELVVWQPYEEPSAWTDLAGAHGRNIAMLGAVFSFIVAVVRSLRQVSKSPSSDK